MNTIPPLLPETTFKPLSPSRLEAMIAHAVSQPQLPRQAQIINFQSRAGKFAFGTGMAALAASIMLALMVTPQYTLTSQATSTATFQTADTTSTDVGDLLLLESLGA